MPKNRACLLLLVVTAALFVVVRSDIASAKTEASTQQEIKVLKKHIHKSKSVVAYWNNRSKGRWALHLRYNSCGDIHGKQRRRVCRKARESLRTHTYRLQVAAAKIDKLTAPRDTGYLPVVEARELGRRMAARVGWSGSQWNCLDSLWGRHESSWRVKADNPGSDAYGIPQALPGSKMGPGWQTSAYVQIKWGLGYVRARFGSPCSALAFRLANGWY